MNTRDDAPQNSPRGLGIQRAQLGDDGELEVDVPVEEESPSPEVVSAQSVPLEDPNAAFDALFASDFDDSEFGDLQDGIPTDTPSMLRRAAKLIKDGDRAGAMSIVEGVLSASKQNADAWYLYAYLSVDRASRIDALNRALAINPDHARAQQMMASLRLAHQDQDLFEGILPKDSAVAQAPVVKKVDDSAFIVGFLLAGFMGLFGVSHMIKGKLATGVGYLFLGFLWIACAAIATVITGFCAGIPLLVLHFYLAWTISKQGATIEPAPSYVV